MRKLIRTSVAFAFMAALPMTGAAQQVAANLPATSARSEQAPDPAIEAQWTAAEETLRSGDYRAALRQFEAIAKVQKENAMNATLTFWKIAEIQNALGSTLRTAQALDEAAQEADRFGDVETQVRALYEAAVAYTAGNQTNRASQRIRRVQGMLDSPGVSDEVREQIRARMGA